MMSNSNYSIGLQRLKPVHTAYGAICMPTRKLYWARDRDVCLPRSRRWQYFSRDDTETRRWYDSIPSRDRDVETETTTLAYAHCKRPSGRYVAIKQIILLSAW